LEFAYFGHPLFNIFIGSRSGLEQIMHMSKSVARNESNDDFIYLNNVRVDLSENFVQMDTGHVLNSRVAANAILSGEHWNLIRNVRKSKETELKHGIFYPIANQKYFYHFLVEELPEIINANEQNSDVIFISCSGQARFVFDLCELAGIKIQILDRKIQLFEQLIIPSYSRINSKWSIEQLKSLKKEKGNNDRTHKKILLLRKGKVRSDEKFEESLLSYLVPFGFQVIDPDNLTSMEQIDIFSNATEIIALHGAALSNIVFSNVDCRIFEIFNHPYRMYVFRELARINGNSYTSTELDSVYPELANWLNQSLTDKADL